MSEYIKMAKNVFNKTTIFHVCFCIDLPSLFHGFNYKNCALSHVANCNHVVDKHVGVPQCTDISNIPVPFCLID